MSILVSCLQETGKAVLILNLTAMKKCTSWELANPLATAVAQSRSRGVPQLLCVLFFGIFGFWNRPGLAVLKPLGLLADISEECRLGSGSGDE